MTKSSKVKGAGDETWAIQCKWHAEDRSVEVDAIRELIGSMRDLETSGSANVRGMLVTTSRFTSGAQRLALRHDITIIDGPEFGSLCDSENRRVTH